jgi:hypothetical protein
MHSNDAAEYVRDHLQGLIAIAEHDPELAFTIYCMEMARQDVDDILMKRMEVRQPRLPFVPRIVE